MSTPPASPVATWDKHLRSLAAGYRGIKSTQDIAATLDAAIAEIDQLRARVAELESGKVSTEWAVRWADGSVGEEIEHLTPTDDGGESYARKVHAQYPNRTEVVSRSVRRGPWSPVTTGGEQ